jgi:hypothetical protein
LGGEESYQHIYSGIWFLLSLFCEVPKGINFERNVTNGVGGKRESFGFLSTSDQRRRRDERPRRSE